MNEEQGPGGAGIREIDRLLESLYGDRRRSASSPDLLDGLVLTILSQNTSDVNSHRAFRSLKEKFPRWDLAAEAGEEEIEEAIRPGGISRVKAARIKAILDMIHEEVGCYSLEHLRGMEPRQALDYLLGIPGVGRKTAAVLLLFRLGYPYFPVDTHILRVGKRLGLIPLDAGPERAHDIMDEIVPDDIKYRLHINLMTHGREVCRARKPNCARCCLIKICDRVGVEEEGNHDA